MALAPGTRLGVYEITAKLGEGGMGEVYRARDTRLHRDVAIKVLPASVAGDADRLARFEREAQVLASLNHPHIAHIHGLEESDGVRALVMELVEGDDLSQRIARGPIPIDEALPMARQIVEALEAAHEQGIIHRDLKPANIKVRADGTVKVLDFGLAKALDQASGSGLQASGGALADSPTITSPAMTMRGVILGTAAYMSPEQAKGNRVDKRADIWAFGAVLFEMLTGRRAFAGEDVSETLVAVLRAEVDWDRLPAVAPPHVTGAIRRCLQKDPRARIADIRDVQLALDRAFETTVPQLSSATAAARPWWRQALPFAVTAVATLIMAGLAGWALWPAAAPRPVLRATIVDPDRPVFPNPLAWAIALSPDGTRAVYRTQTSSGLALAVRSLDSLETRLLFESPIGASSPAFSPDGAWVAFTENRSIKRVALAGGPALTICQVTDRVDGMAWTDDGFLIFGAADTAAVNTGLMRVPVEGGSPEPLTTVNEADGELTHAWPEMLPGGKAVLFTIRQKSPSTSATDSIAVLDLESRSYRTVVTAGHGAARYVPTGHLVYEQEGQLLAVSFDRRTSAVTGNPVAVLTGLATRANGALEAAVSGTGTLAYLTASDDLQTSVPVWVDRRGVAQEIAGIEADRYRSPRLSPDGRRFITTSNGDAWIIETGNGRRRRVTTDGRTQPSAAWSPDGSKVAYVSARSGSSEIWVQPADGSGAPERVTFAKGAEAWSLSSWSPDGRLLAGFRLAGGAAPFVLPLAGADRQPRFLPLARRAAYDAEPQFSPNGRYVAFVSGINRQWDVELHPVEGAGARIPVSVEGGVEPIWAQNGELFYRHPITYVMMHVRITMNGALTVPTPAQLFDASAYASWGGGGSPRALYDVTADGQRFLMLRPVKGASSTPPQLVLIQNWFEELQRLVPGGGEP